MQGNFKVVIGYRKLALSGTMCAYPLNTASNMHLAALLAGTDSCLGGGLVVGMEGRGAHEWRREGVSKWFFRTRS